MSTADATQQPDFDPTQGFITLGKGREAKQYLTVNWRVEWLRQEHPDASIVTEAISITDSAAVFKATVTLPSGAVGVGHGSQSAKQFPSFLEKAETKAIGRALAAIGYGTLSAFLEDADGDVIADTPVAQPQRQAQSRQQPEPTPIRPKALDWPDERLLGSLGGDAGDARVAVAARIYLDRATDKATLTARYTAARKAGLPKEVADELALARADQLGIPRAEPKPPPPPDDLTSRSSRRTRGWSSWCGARRARSAGTRRACGRWARSSTAATI